VPHRPVGRPAAATVSAEVVSAEVVTRVKKSTRKRGRSTSPFVMLPWHLLDSHGWHALSPYARLAYIELCRRYNGANNGIIGLSVRTLGLALRCSKATAARALTELENAGFIQTMRIGTFKRKDRLASEYRLNIHRCDVTGDIPNRAWNTMQRRPDGLTGETIQSQPKDRGWVKRTPQSRSRDRQT
jgi:hypothetical protein